MATSEGAEALAKAAHSLRQFQNRDFLSNSAGTTECTILSAKVEHFVEFIQRLRKFWRQIAASSISECHLPEPFPAGPDVGSNLRAYNQTHENLVEALELFFESADPTEVARRLHGEVFVTRVEVMVG